MRNEDAKDRRLIEYLLGHLSETEQTQLEDVYFADDARFEYLAAVETELIDAYARGELPDPDRVHFEQRFLASPRLRARIALARRLQARVLPAVGPSAREMSREETRHSAARRSTPMLIGAVTVVVVVSAAAVGWWALQSTSPRAAAVQADSAPPAGERVPPALPAAQALPTADRHTTGSVPITLVLAPGSIGSGESRAVLTMPQGADVVRIQVDHEGAARERYAVLVGTPDRQRVWTELNMAARAAGAKSVILEIPASSLPPGDYVLTLSGGAMGVRRLEALADYSFRVR
jgi:anti-sigma factor RsiW